MLKSLKDLMASANKCIANCEKQRAMAKMQNGDQLNKLRKKSMSATIAKGVYLRLQDVVSNLYDKEGNDVLGKLEGTLHRLEDLTKDLEDGK